MFGTFLGMPTHVLIIHLVVMLVPLACIVTVAVTAVARWRRRLAWWVVGLDAFALAATLVAKKSGEEFFRLLGEPAAAAEHTQLGSSMPWFVLGLLVVALLAALVRTRRDALSTTVGLLAVAVAAASLVWVVRTGHEGTRAVWQGVVQSTQSSGR
jgi:hypothetical protein